MGGLKKGDRVRVTDPGWGWGKTRCGEKAVVQDDPITNNVYLRFDNGEGWWAARSQVTLVTKEGEHEMSDVQENPGKALRNLNLDADTRLLRGLGFENELGEPLDAARVEVLRRQWAAIRTGVAADLRTALANEKTDAEPTPAVK